MIFKKIALTFIIYFLLIFIFIVSTLFKYNSNLRIFGGEMSDGILLIGLMIATIYYFILTVWTYRIYRSDFTNLSSIKFQLGLIFLLGILSSIYLLTKAFT